MSREQLYTYAVIGHPTDEAIKSGARSKLLVAPNFKLARSEAEVLLMVAREIPAEAIESYGDRLEVAVRTF